VYNLGFVELGLLGLNVLVLHNLLGEINVAGLLVDTDDLHVVLGFDPEEFPHILDSLSCRVRRENVPLPVVVFEKSQVGPCFLHFDDLNHH